MLDALESVSWLWTHESAYNWASSEWGAQVFHLFDLIVIYVLLQRLVSPLMHLIHGHMECTVDGCSKWGHPVPGTSYRACHDHSPAVAHEPGERVTVEHIAEAHSRGVART